MTKHLCSENNSKAAGRSPSLQTAGEPADRETIAELSYETIGRMTPEELVRLIRAADLSVLATAVEDRLDQFDVATLRRLAHIARFSWSRRVSHQEY